MGVFVIRIILATGSSTRLVCPRFLIISYRFLLYANETFFYRNYEKRHPQDFKLLFNSSTVAAVIK
jgi:hypothetical protein